MGLTTSLVTGLSGLNSAQFRLDTIGDNIANVNTIGYKGTRSNFETQFSQTLSAGSPPSGSSGGTNPTQIGLGSTLSSVQRIFTQGSIEATGFPTDLAIQGHGFFVIRTPGNEQVYTRDGSFALNASHQLISQNGGFVRGFGVDANAQIVPGVLTDIRIPLGELTSARATTRVDLSGGLNSNGALATQGSIHESQSLVIDAGGTPLTSGTTALVDLRDATAPATPLFAAGTTLTIAGVKRGGQDVPGRTLNITATTTVADFLRFMDDSIGIDTSAGLPGAPGTGIVNGRLQIRGNVGIANAIDIPVSSLVTNNAASISPLNFTQTQAANGESVHTSFLLYDSLGAPVTVDVTAVLESRGNNVTNWRYYAYSSNDSDPDRVLGTGTLSFDSNGQFVPTAQPVTIQVDRANTGAATPMAITLDFSRLSGLTVRESALVMTSQDGFPPGTLIDFAIGNDGVVTGVFSNGQSRLLGQIALATFPNEAGLVQRAGSLFDAGPNSGPPQITAPQALGAGQLQAGALEGSNVDISRQFIDLISASTMFSASGRVISTSDQLLQELLLVARR